MKFLIVLVALCAVALAAPPTSNNKDVEIVRSEQDVGVEGFKYDFETSDGVVASQQGQIKNLGAENEGISVTGSYAFVGEDGVTYTVTYTADENGFQPQGAHLPVAPVA